MVPQVTNKINIELQDLVLAPQGFLKKRKGYPRIWEANLQPLRAKQQAKKCSKLAPKFFSRDSQYIKRARGARGVGEGGSLQSTDSNGVEPTSKQSICPQNICKIFFIGNLKSYGPRRHVRFSLVRWSSGLKAGCGMTCDGVLSTKYTIRFIRGLKKETLTHS